MIFLIHSRLFLFLQIERVSLGCKPGICQPNANEVMRWV